MPPAQTFRNTSGRSGSLRKLAPHVLQMEKFQEDSDDVEASSSDGRLPHVMPELLAGLGGSCGDSGMQCGQDFCFFRRPTSSILP
jgi:hypothetical protein